MLNFGMPDGFGALLAQKYALLGLTAEAGAKETNARTGLINTQNALLPGTTAADIAKTQAETGGINETTKYIGPTAQANIDKTKTETTGLGLQNKTTSSLLGSSLRGVFGDSTQFPSLFKGMPSS